MNGSSTGKNTTLMCGTIERMSFHRYKYFNKLSLFVQIDAAMMRNNVTESKNKKKYEIKKVLMILFYVSKDPCTNENTIYILTKRNKIYDE